MCHSDCVEESLVSGGLRLPAHHVTDDVQRFLAGDDLLTPLLRQAIRSCLTLAEEKALTSIAFPAISTGIYGFPIERAAPLMLKEAADYLDGATNLRRVVFCLYDRASYRVFESAFIAL